MCDHFAGGGIGDIAVIAGLAFNVLAADKMGELGRHVVFPC
jgi:hypothetical protein